MPSQQAVELHAYLIALPLQGHATPDGIVPRSERCHEVSQLCRVAHLRSQTLQSQEVRQLPVRGGRGSRVGEEKGRGGSGDFAMFSGRTYCQITWMVLCRILQFPSKTMRRVHSLRRSWAVVRIRSSCALVTGMRGGAIERAPANSQPCPSPDKQPRPCRAFSGLQIAQAQLVHSGATRQCTDDQQPGEPVLYV